VDERTGPVAEEESWGTGRVASRTARVVRNRRTTGTRDTRHTNESRFNQHLDRKQYKVKYGGRSPKFIWAPCHGMCTAVLIG
jgi:hypothetical protein